MYVHFEMTFNWRREENPYTMHSVLEKYANIRNSDFFLFRHYNCQKRS